MPARNVNLTDHLARFVDDSVASGHFQNASEVVREGLRLLEQRREEDALKLERLRRAVQEGLDDAEQGNVIEVDVDDLPAFIAGLGRRAGS
jgi:antitoxin ParD1/3/4